MFFIWKTFLKIWIGVGLRTATRWQQNLFWFQTGCKIWFLLCDFSVLWGDLRIYKPLKQRNEEFSVWKPLKKSLMNSFRHFSSCFLVFVAYFQLRLRGKSGGGRSSSSAGSARHSVFHPLRRLHVILPPPHPLPEMEALIVRYTFAPAPSVAAAANPQGRQQNLVLMSEVGLMEPEAPPPPPAALLAAVWGQLGLHFVPFFPAAGAASPAELPPPPRSPPLFFLTLTKRAAGRSGAERPVITTNPSLNEARRCGRSEPSFVREETAAREMSYF